ncbi:flagellar biosynthetic protein FliO [Yersinia bercovieri]|nr:flagellar biosynthetic protein FliO [Yersinia bercovieri]CFQ36143.1 flagellar protein FliO [Yersinia bercovieri]CNF29178.1 flagellar protein FliO [Yersinia bercovieri]CNI84332.1 flagellar protein FliO [Yersinia bercovieri]
MNTQTIHSMSEATNSGSILATVGGSLILILMIITAIAWIARRTGLTPRLPKGNQILSVVSSYSLGQRERIVVVDIGDKRLLLGVTTSQISCLGTFDQFDDHAMTPEPLLSGDFQSTLLGMLKKRKAGPTA